MLFTRPATIEDFQGYDIAYDYGQYMSEEVKKLIEEKNFSGAVHLFRKQTGMGMVQIKAYCKEYQNYYQAKCDFENGKPVFVSY